MLVSKPLVKHNSLLPKNLIHLFWGGIKKAYLFKTILSPQSEDQIPHLIGFRQPQELDGEQDRAGQEDHQWDPTSDKAWDLHRFL